MLKGLFSFFILSIPVLLLGQNISSIRIVDSEIYPYKSYSEQIAFEYNIMRCGEVSGYIKYNNETILLFNESRVFKGVEKCYISFKTYKEIFGSNYTNKSFVFGINHLSCREYIPSERELFLEARIFAPYGTELYSLPSKPNLLFTNHKIKKKNNKAALGMVGGYALTILGGITCYVILDRGESLDWQPVVLTLAGIVIVVNSKNKLYYSVPNNALNYQNERKNQGMISQWKRETERVNYLNEKIKATFKIKIQLK